MINQIMLFVNLSCVYRASIVKGSYCKEVIIKNLRYDKFYEFVIVT